MLELLGFCIVVFVLWRLALLLVTWLLETDNSLRCQTFNSVLFVESRSAESCS